MWITVEYQGTTKLFETTSAEVVLGRPYRGSSVDLDLTPDQTTSRHHARITTDGKHFWIEDLNSRKGTLVSGIDIRGLGKQQLNLGEKIYIGRTTILVEESSVQTIVSATPLGELGESLDAAQPVHPNYGSTADIANRLKLFLRTSAGIRKGSATGRSIAENPGASCRSPPGVRLEGLCY